MPRGSAQHHPYVAVEGDRTLYVLDLKVNHWEVSGGCLDVREVPSSGLRQLEHGSAGVPRVDERLAPGRVFRLGVEDREPGVLHVRHRAGEVGDGEGEMVRARSVPLR
jgi:hypothetical protein